MAIQPTGSSFQTQINVTGTKEPKEKEPPLQEDQVLCSLTSPGFNSFKSISIPSIPSIQPVQAIQPVQPVQAIQAVQPISSISGGGNSPLAKANVVSTSLASQTATAGSGTAAVFKALEDQIAQMEQMKSLMDSFGNKAKAQEIGNKIAAKKNELAAVKASPPHVFSQKEKEEISSYIEGKGPMPSSFKPEQQQALDRMSSLARNGMHFSIDCMKEIPPDEAFVRIMENPYASFGNQVSFKTFEDNSIVMATLRPQYLAPLDVFITGTKKGYVFYDTSSGSPKPVQKATDFISRFKDHLDEAVVWAVDGSYVTPEKADEIKARLEMEEMASELSAPTDRPSIEEDNDVVIIGGIVLEKKH
ncbi:MAG: hypothetical protein AB2L14_24390 [Candidatus Xenobiia bacterium LiM19]